jgi:hypothetical protein
VSQVAITAIQAMLAPVVLMTTAAILAGGVQTMYAGVNDRMRTLAAEKFSRLTGNDGGLTPKADLPLAAKERVAEIDAQLPLLLQRHRMLHDALQLIYLAILIIVVAMILIAISITVPAPGIGDAALGVVLGATILLLLGLVSLARTVHRSDNAIVYEVDHVLRIGSS